MKYKIFSFTHSAKQYCALSSRIVSHNNDSALYIHLLNCILGRSQHCLRNHECTLIVVDLSLVEKAQTTQEIPTSVKHTKTNMALWGHPNNVRNSSLVLSNYLTHTEKHPVSAEKHFELALMSKSRNSL